ncbi:hypothetical protein CGZ94_01350 [Enemella evansiae]|uniref:DUF11 domain-containing protein n=1 Tax=Enemella evansiae TaxID=2016499 RepID=A0A255GW88_9ACTN|nr:hypothetical protein CGZ94_01350 [Enemella evansiae]
MRHPQRRRTTKLHPVVAWLVLASSLVMPGLLPIPSTPAYAAPGPDGQDPTACLNTVALANGGFEQPVIPARNYRILPQTSVPGWNTTASDGMIELWSTGFNGVPSSSGNQFAELNANLVSTLYQDVPTTPGQTLYYSLDHRGRVGSDTMALDLGAPGATPNFSRQMTDGTTAWGKYTGSYTVPAGQTVTRFAFRSVSASGGNQSVGNFLDNISFGTGACLVTTKSQTNISRTSGPAQVGDVIEYTVTTTNQGGSPSTGTVISDPVPANTAYVPGSLSVTASPTAGQTGTKTDAVDGDVGSYANGTVRFNVGDGATGTQGGIIEPGAAVTTKFRTRILPTGAEQTITNQASVAYTDRDGSAKTSLSGRVSTPVAPAADLAISKTSTPTTQTAGSNVTYNVTVTNNGPSTATGVQFVDTLPAGTTYVSSAPPAGTSCSVSGRYVTCVVGSLANGASVTVPITTTISPDVTTAQVNTATVSSTTSDYNSTNDTATVQTGVTTAADVSLTKTASPTTVAPGNNVTYTLTAANAGPSVASAVKITDVLPTGMSYVSATAPAGTTCTESSGTITCQANSLAVGASIPITIVAKVAASTPSGQLVNTGRVSSTTTDPNAANNTASATVTIAPQADLQVVKTVLTNPVVAGQQVRFSIKITNNGPSDAANVTLNDPSTTGLTFVSSTTSQGSCSGTGTVTCQIGTIAAGASVTVTTTYLVAADRQAAMTNTATATSDTADPNQGNNTGSVTVTPTTSADLQLSKTQSPAQFNYGDAITYNLSVLNNGPSTARNAVITDTLQDGVTFVSASSGCTINGRTVTCQVGDLAPQQTASVSIRVQTPAGGSGPLTNTAQVSSSTPDPVPGNNTSTYTASGGQQADLSIVKTTSGNGTLVAGEQVTYTLQVTNNGPSAATGVRVTDTLPSGVSFVSSSSPCSTSGQTVTCTISNLEPGSTTITIVGRVAADARGTSSNTATVTATTPDDPTSSNNTSTSTSTVTGRADVFVTLTPDTQTVNAGAEATFQLVIGNNGPSTAQNVVVTGQVPPGMTPVAGSAGGACVVTGTTVTCNVGTLQPGQTLPPITLRALVDNSVPPGTTITATAQVQTSTTDTNAANNTSSARVVVAAQADIALAKTVSPSPLVAGGTASYVITATNNGPSDASNLVVTDQLPSSFRIASATIAGQPCTVTGQTVSCSRPVIAAKDVVRITVTGTVDSNATGSLRNVATATTETPDPNTANNTAEVTADISQSADLRIRKEAPQRVVAGSTIAYKVIVANAGPSDAAAVVLTDPFPAQVRPVGVSDPACQLTGQDLRCDFGTVAAGTSRTVVVEAVADPAVEAGSTITNTASVSSTTPGAGTRQSTVNSTVDSVADVSMVKRSASTPIAGGLMRYELTVTNNGPSTARGVIATDPTPAGTSYIDAVPSSGSCSDPTQSPDMTCVLGDMAPGQSITILVRYQLDPQSTGQTLTNTARVATTTTDPNSDNNSSTTTDQIGEAAKLTINKELTSGPVVAGGTATYRITVGNDGPSVARGVRVTDTIQAPAEYVSATADGGGTCTPSGTPTTLTCDFASVGVGAGEVRTITLTVRIPADTPDGTQIANSATATSQTPSDPATDDATGTVGSSADVSVTKTLLTANPVAGAPISWQVTVRNAGPSTARAITLSDPAPAGVRITGGTPDAGSCAVNQQGGLDCQLGDLAPGDDNALTVRVDGVVNPDFSGDLTNRATATSTTPDPNTENNSGGTTNPVGGSADLALAKTPTSPRATAGGAIGWTVTVTNNGPSDATGVQIKDAVPAGVQNPTASINGTACTLTDGTFTCPVDRIAAGGTATMTISGTVDPNATGQIANTASVTATTPDPDPSNNEATSSVPLDAAADLSVTKTGPATATAGTSISWTVTARNAGPSVARAVVISDPLPAGVNGATATFNGNACAVENGALTCRVGDLAPGATAEITVTGTIDQGRTEPVVNTATVASQTGDPNGADNTATTTTEVTSSANLSITKVADTDSFTAGRPVGWTLTVRNDGPSAAVGVQVTDQLPAGLVNPTATLPDGTSCEFTGGTVTCPIGVLGTGEVRQLRITGTLAADYAGADLTNAAQVSSQTPEGDGADNSTSTTTPVAAAADLEVDKKIVGPVVAGAPITFEVTLTNNGPSVSRNARLSDPVPNQISGITVDDPACTVTGQDVACGFGDLAVGASRTIRITGTVSQSFDDRFRNTATATSDTGDPIQQNNTGSADGVVGESADLQVTKTGPAQVTAGSPIIWTIEVRNAGPSTARAVSVNDQLPAGLTNGQLLLPNGQPCPDPTNCAIGDLGPGQAVTLTVTGTVAPDYSGTTISNSVGVATPTADPDGGNNNDTSTVAVNRDANLSIAKTLTSGPLVPGTEETYSITVRNAGPSTADAATVADRLPAGLTVVGQPTTTAGTCTVEGQQLDCALGNLAPNATATIGVTVQVDPNLTGQVVNVASVTSTTPDGDTADNSATSTEPTAPSADVSVTKTLLTQNPVAGAPIAWEVVVRNAGPSTARAITLDDPAPTGARITGGTPDAGSCAVDAAGALSCQLGDIAPGAQVRVRVDGVVNADFTGELTNRATATSTTSDPNGGNNSDDATAPVANSADLALTKTATTERVTAGGPIGWTVTVTNNGPSDATGVRITDRLPATVLNPTVTINGTPCALADGAYTCPVDRIAPAGTATVTITGTADPAATGDIANTASVTATTPDPNQGNNSGTSTVPVDTTADVSVTKTGPATATAGTAISWTVTARNAGPSVARAVVVTDQIPAGINGAAASVNGNQCAVQNGALTCPLGDLAPGASVEITVTGTIDQARTEPVVNTATVASQTTDPNGADNTATTTTEVTASADLAITKAADPGFTAGDTVGWTITVRNDGPSTATGVEVTDQLPAGLNNPTARLGDVDCAIDAGVVTCPIGTLASGDVRQIRITGTLAADYAGTGVTNGAQLTSQTPDPDAGDNTTSITTPVATSADLEVDKKIVGTVVAGAPITFEVTVTNNGPSVARAVTLTDPVPSQVTGVAADDPACTVTGQDVSCGLGDLAVGASRTIRITGTVSQSFSDRFTNTATATSTTPDPNEQNNSGSADGTVGESADVQVTKTGPAQVTAGAPVSWTIEVRNAGPSTARTVTVADQLPAGLVGGRVLLPNGQPCADPSNCAIGDLTPGQTVTLTVTGTIAPDYADTTIRNSASVATPTADPDGGNNDATSVVTVNRDANLSISKALTTGPLVPGTQESYTITVRNAGPSTATGAVVSDRLPDGLTVVGVPTSSAGSCTVTGQQVSCDLGTVAPNATVTIQVAVQVDPNVTGDVVNVASVIGTTPDGNTGDNSATSTEPTAPSADVSVTKTLLTENPVAGAPISWQVTVRNAGPSTARGITLDDPAPTGVTITGGTPDAGSCAVNAAGALECQLGDLAPDNAITVRVDGTVGADFTGDLTNRATATSSTPDPNGGNNSDDATSPVGGSADLALTKTPTAERATAGGPIGWTVTVTNNGPSDATDVRITDAVPAGVTGAAVSLNGVPCPVADGTFTCSIARVPARGTVTVQVTGTVDPGVIGEIANTASVTASTPDPDAGNNTGTSTVPVDTTANVSVTKTGPAAATAGTSVSWTVTARNAGPSVARAVLVSDQIPAGISGATATVNGAQCAIADGALTCPLGDLAPGASVEITVTGTIDQGRTEPVVNTATVGSQTTDPNGDDNTATTTTEVTSSANLSVSKVADAGTFTAGQAAGWTITARNNGPSTAVGVQLTDQLPAGLVNPTATLSDGTACQIAGGTVTCPIGTLAAGDSRQLRITGTLAADYAGAEVANTARIESQTPDPTPGDNTSTATTPAAASADLEVDKKIVGSVVAGAPITFEVTVTNNGPSLARAVTLTDPVPSQVGGITVDDPACTVTGQDVSCGFGDLAVGASRTVRITGTVGQNFDTGFTNTATATSATPDPIQQNNSGSADGTVGESADVQVTKTGPAEVVAGAPVTWTIEVRNAGPSTARTVSVADQLPAGLVDGRVVLPNGQPCADPANCAIGDLTPGQTVTLTVTGTVAPDYAGTAIRNSVGISSPTADPDGGNNNDTSTVAVTRNADLSIAKQLTTGPLVPGTEERYTITVRNGGPSTAEGVTVADRLPAGLSVVGEPTASAGQCRMTGQQLDCALGTLAPNATVTIEVTVRVDANLTGDVVNVASVTGTTPDGNTGDNSATSTEPTTPQADLTITKTGPATVVAGQPISWTLRVQNAGPSFATGVTVRDELPAGLTGATVRTDQGQCRIDAGGPSGTVNCDLGTVGVGDDVTITVMVDAGVSAAYTGQQLVNTATVTSPTPEPNPGGDDGRSDDATTTVTRDADLSITKTHDPGAAVIPGAPGPEGLATWTLIVTNDGPSTARNTTVTDSLPAGLSDVTFQTPDGVACTPTGACALGELQPGQTVRITVSGRLPADYADQQVINRASVGSDDPDGEGSDNTSTDAIPVSPSSDVQVTKTGPAQVVAGTQIAWELRVADNGPSTATGVVLTDRIPAGLGNPQVTAPAGMTCAITDGLLTCRANGPLAPGDANALTVRLTADVPADRLEPIINTAEVTSGSFDGTGDNNTATTTTEVTGSADLSVAKAINTEVVKNGTVTAGQPVAWTITVRNDGPSVARTVTLTDLAPAAVRDLTLTSSQGTCTANRCDLGDLAPGRTVTIQVRGTVDPDATGTLVNTAEVGSPTSDPDPGDNRDDADPITIGRSADLSITKTADPSPAMPGAQLRYTLTVRNAGPSTAQQATVTDVLPTGLQNPQVDDQRCTITGGVLDCDLGTVPAGASQVITVTGTVAVDQQGDLSNTASVSSPDPDPNPGNNSSNVGTPTAPANLSITKTASAAQVNPGGDLTWTLTVRNAGPGPARRVAVTDTLPAGVEVTSVTPSTGTCTPVQGQVLTCDPGVIAADGTMTITIAAKVSERALGALTNSATVTSPDDPNPGDNTAQVTTPVVATADLSVTKKVVSGGTVAGEPVGWELTVRNDGPAAAVGVRLHDTLPAGVTNPTLGPVPDGVTCAITGNAVDCTAAQLAAGTDFTVTVNATVAPATRGELSNAASVTSDTRDPDPADNTGTTTSTVTGKSNVAVTKTASSGAVTVGDQVRYTITATGSGPSTATGVTVTEQLPGGATVLEARTGTGRYQQGTWTIGDLAPGQTATLELVVRLDRAGQAANSVRIAAVEDPAGDDNSATATVTVNDKPVPPTNPPTTQPPTNPGQPPTTQPPGPGQPPTGPGQPPYPLPPGQPGQPPMPNTGNDWELWQLLLAFGMLPAGVALIAIGRRRRRRG